MGALYLSSLVPAAAMALSLYLLRRHSLSTRGSSGDGTLSLLCWQRQRHSLSTCGDGTLSSLVLAAVMALSLSTCGDGTLSLLAAMALSIYSRR